MKDIFFKRLFILMTMIVLLALLYQLKTVILPFLIAFIFAYLLNPFVSAFQLYRLPRWFGIVIVYLVISITGLLIARLLIPQIWEQLVYLNSQLPTIIAWYNETFRSWVSENIEFVLPPVSLDNISHSFIVYLQDTYNVDDAKSVMSNVLLSGLNIINLISLMVLVPILCFYFLLTWQDRLHQLVLSIPPRYRAKTIEIAKDCDIVLMSFVKGQLLVMVLLGIIYAIQLQLIGLELGIIIGLVSGIASFVPYLGFAIGFIAAVIAGFFQFGVDWLYLSLIIGAFLIGQAIEGYVLQPLLLGDRIGLSPLWVIFSVLAGASLLGFTGMLIALPVAAVLSVLFKHAYDAYQRSSYYTPSRQYRLFK